MRMRTSVFETNLEKSFERDNPILQGGYTDPNGVRIFFDRVRVWDHSSSRHLRLTSSICAQIEHTRLNTNYHDALISAP